MAINDFDNHLQEVGNVLEDLLEARKNLESLLSRHFEKNYSALIAGDFANRAVTKTDYDAAFVSINDLLNVWFPAGHGTNINNYLNESP